MIHLKLELSSTPQIELLAISFTDSELAIRTHAGRGRGSFDHSKGSFSWSAGVIALTELLLTHALCEKSASGQVRGQRGSSVASLDYALAKDAKWLVDMFGADASGRAYARRVILRDNPEGKRPGPITLSIHPARIPGASIKVFSESKEICTTADLQILLDQLKSQVPNKIAPLKAGARLQVLETTSKPRATHNSLGQRWLMECSKQEAARALDATQQFSKTELELEISAISRNETIQKISCRGRSPFPKDALTMSWAERMGLHIDWKWLRCQMEAQGTFRVGISTGGVAAILLCDYLALKKNLPLLVNYRFANSQETIERIRSGTFTQEVDAINLSIPCACKLSSQPAKSEFYPLCIFPRNSHAGVNLENSKKMNSKAALFAAPLSSARLFQDQWDNRKELNNNFVLEDIESLLRAFASESKDISTALWWPHYELLSLAFPKLEVTRLESNWGFESTILFASQHYFTSEVMSRMLASAFRCAWLSLLEHPELIEELLAFRIENEDFLNHSTRSLELFRPAIQANLLRRYSASNLRAVGD